MSLPIIVIAGNIAHILRPRLGYINLHRASVYILCKGYAIGILPIVIFLALIKGESLLVSLLPFLLLLILAIVDFHS